MSWRNFLSPKHEELVAIIDVGSAQVSAALVTFSYTKGHATSRVVKSTKVHTEIPGELDFERFNAETVKAIKRCLSDLLYGQNGSPHRFVCFLSSPFTISQTKIINYDQEDKFTFTEKMLGNITQREANAFRSKYDGNLEIIDNRIMQIKLDGYESLAPFGHSVRQIEVAQFLCGSPAGQLKMIRQAISTAGHNDRIEFNSYSFAAFVALRNTLSDKKNFFAVDIGGEMTDIFVSINGTLLENLSFPYGLNSVIRSIARDQNSTFALASSQMTLYLDGKLNEQNKARVDKSLKSAQTKWSSAFADALNLILENSVLPEHVILMGDTHIHPIFMEWIKSGDFRKFRLSNEPFRLAYIDHARLAEVAGMPKSVYDTYLMFETIFLENLGLNKII